MIRWPYIPLLPRLAAVLPSVVVAVAHFKLSTLVGPRANQVFQHWFDTGEQATGADALVASIDRWLSIPVPAVMLAGHPARPPSALWWLPTGINSAAWGLALYGCYWMAYWLLQRWGIGKGRG